MVDSGGYVSLWIIIDHQWFMSNVVENSSENTKNQYTIPENNAKCWMLNAKYKGNYLKLNI